jgi:hypothetical protein
MADQVWVDTDRMSLLAPRIDELARRIEGERRSLVERTGLLYDAPGIDDSAARMFFESYEPNRRKVLDSMHAFALVARGVVDGLRTMEQGYTRTEHDNTVPTFGDGHRTPKGHPAKP